MKLIGDMVAELERLGDLGPWRAPLYEVPRHLFVPERAWCTPDGRPGYLIDRSRDPEQWVRAAYTDMAIVTQLDDGATDIGSGDGEYTCSLSAPSMVLAGLSLLSPERGDRVLEIGTGTGWTAALLSHRVGAENVTTVEVDPALGMRAVERLKAVGYRPRVVVGDGAEGFPERAPYDRVHVTCGVREVPYAWVEQTRPGGVIVLPWMHSPHSGELTRLTVHEDGTATGRFYGEVDFMMLRAQRRTDGRGATKIGHGLTVTPEGQRIWLDGLDDVM
ncbi:methyltransferase domain-containing protein [Thermomonospora cellulosilytica]|uniref:Protein-L-isoaspartate O-methyltransferase n=1 Tax=Thermomonospora cellulosilytica TaxID=1411118 RepID=A0A7W3MVH2_9ACTN|nr:methyltransferase domain-containing protein [Thermomonospora cellulosilytica]MBA9002648.1 protein-L-isoaspartate(D-aspartate) O-methyltransferase [Thermomonospora cellulosilytica]